MAANKRTIDFDDVNPARGQQTFKDHPPREINCFEVAACTGWP